ncbi:cell division protein ZapA [Desulfallas thermosapovorans]|uniref:Cell division protein ZapA n=1 Tax=Desulfallas thermosapovorans DSM 6562 TaxID=1121431 RepID=A0A5S4ZP53_9FIRM|nr:cell division protein ZapA [Desulfallas thermosapovorans]TYO94558.1 cell division protein ZapA [Desulfallas thermosapovorans DSM 6562]
MSDEHNRIDVEINGVRYTLKGDNTPENMFKMSRYVDEQLKQVMRRNPRLSLYKAAVLVALNITEELFNLREEYENLVHILEPESKQKK